MAGTQLVGSKRYRGENHIDWQQERGFGNEDCSNLADRKHLVELVLHHCDVDAFFGNKCETDENNSQADQVRKERFHLHAQDLLMKDDEVNELDFVADDEEPPEYGESECPWSIKLKLCNETIDKASAIKIFSNCGGRTDKNTSTILYGCHLAWIILNRATSIKMSSFLIEDDSHAWYSKHKSGIAFTFEEGNGNQLEIYIICENFCEKLEYVYRT